MREEFFDSELYQRKLSDAHWEREKEIRFQQYCDRRSKIDWDARMKSAITLHTRREKIVNTVHMFLYPCDEKYKEMYVE